MQRAAESLPFCNHPRYLGPQGVPRQNKPSAGQIQADHKEGNGEPGAVRTHDPRIKRALLYQLSYGLASATNCLR
jgi:hypothetical protein